MVVSHYTQYLTIDIYYQVTFNYCQDQIISLLRAIKVLSVSFRNGREGSFS